MVFNVEKQFPKIIVVVIFWILGIQSQGLSAGWQVLEGKWARVEFQPPYQTLAQNLLFIANQEIPRLLELHGLDSTKSGHLPKVRIILTDKPDVSNGFALGNSVVIYAQSSMYMLYWAEEAPWYFTVLTHELAHWVTFQAIRRKLTVFGQAFNLTVPRWFFEGMAQYCAETWNFYRGDIFVKQALFYGDLNYSALTNLKNGRLLYASANAFVRFLASQYGDSALSRLMRYKPQAWYYDFDEAFKAVFKQTPKTLFKEFVRHAVLYYGGYLSQLPEHRFRKWMQNFNLQRLYAVFVLGADSTFLVLGKEKRSDRFVTLYHIKIRQGKVESKKRLTNRLATQIILSPDRKRLAFGVPFYSVEENQLNLKFVWRIVELQNFRQQTIPGTFRARYGAFDFENNFYLVEVTPQYSAIHQILPDLRMVRNWFKSEKEVIGPLTFTPDHALVFVAEKNGQRVLRIKRRNNVKMLAKGQGILNVKTLSKHHLLLNVVERAHSHWRVFDLHTFQPIGEMVDLFQYQPVDVDSFNRTIFAFRNGADGQPHFYEIPFDSLLQTRTATKIATASRYGNWRRFEPVRSDSIFKRRWFAHTETNYRMRSKRLPYFPMEHLLSFGWPLYDQQNGWGAYGLTAWTEALQRQAVFAFFYILPNHWDRSLYSFSHMLRAFNWQFNTGLYHGPAFFSFEDQKWVYLTQNLFYFEAQKQIFPAGNNRWRFWVNLNYRVNHNRITGETNLQPTAFKFQGPATSLVLRYLLPTTRGVYFPVRYFRLKGAFFQTINSDFAFRVFEGDLDWGGRLFLDDLYFYERIAYVQQSGSLPPLKHVGIDSYYQLDLPRDYTYTRSVRGIQQDVYASRLWWNSFELRYFVQEKTGYKLLLWPLNRISLDFFSDYANLNRPTLKEFFSFGMQISSTEAGVRFSAGLARSFVNWKGGNTSVFVRLSVNVDALYQSRFIRK